MPRPANQHSDETFAIAAFTELGLAMIAILLGSLFGPNVREHIPRWGDRAGLIEAVVWGVPFGIGLVFLMQGVSKLPLRSLKRLDQIVDDRLQSVLLPLTSIQMVVLSMTAGIGEELLFRGWLQRLLVGDLAGEWFSIRVVPGLVLASLLFGLAHPISKAYVVLASFIGLLLGLLYLLTENLLACILAHALYDAILMLLWKTSESSST
ncbi:MAG: CPBP family intramembrane glutamic endopeptidase [Planctomycetota bacterium]|jgi:membrane protease YdiL (CAAX protease family)